MFSPPFCVAMACRVCVNWSTNSILFADRGPISVVPFLVSGLKIRVQGSGFRV